jgi:hypothetical protein
VSGVEGTNRGRQTREEEPVYIGIGTVVAILIIILLLVWLF